MNEKVLLAFVILHYNVIEETMNCVKSIKKMIDTEYYHIIIVDNLSQNKSGNSLYKYYLKDDKVTVILNKENLGFAKGNNVGIDYAKNILNASFVCCMNNDTLMLQSDFYTQIIHEYEFSNAAVIGPCVILKNDDVQYFNSKILTEQAYIKQLNDYRDECIPALLKIKLFMYHVPLLNLIIKNRNKKRAKNSNFRKENVILHGCCLIFTPAFFNELSGFMPDTFLFREEELLYISLQRKKLLNVYTPSLRIKHLEDAATDSQFRERYEKEEFLRQNQIHSLEILIKELHDYNLEREES